MKNVNFEGLLMLNFSLQLQMLRSHCCQCCEYVGHGLGVLVMQNNGRAGVGDQSGGDRTDQTDQPPLVTGPGHFTQQLAQGSTSSSPTAGANHQVV